MNKVIAAIAWCVSSLTSLPALADFIIDGPVKATSCSGIGIQSCSTVEVQAVKGSDGRTYEIKKRLASVTEYNERKGRCSVDFSNRGSMSIASKLSSSANTPVFLEVLGSGQHVEVKPDYISFKCRKE
jgi:hypothetical protein